MSAFVHRASPGRAGGLVAAGLGLACATASATVTPTQLFGDSYIVREGDRIYSVLDIYLKCSASSDIISSLFGLSAYPSSFAVSGGKLFAQSNGTAMSAWLPTNDDGSMWDSFVTCGARVQGSDTTLAGGKAGFLGMQLDTNWAASSSGGAIVGQAGGPGWYPSIGASTSTNPYCRAGYYTGSDAINMVKANRTLTANGLVPGQSVTNHWMIGRFTIEVSGDEVGTSQTMSLKFGIASKSVGICDWPPACSISPRFNWTLTFAPRPCDGDIDCDGLCDGWDLGLLLLDFGPCPNCPSDIDGSGTVDTGDMSLLLMDWNAPC